MRLAVLSNERLDLWINWSTLGPPLRNALAQHRHTAVVSPPALTWRHRAEWREALQQARGSDTLFWIQGSARPELPLLALSALRGTPTRPPFSPDSRNPSLGKIGALALHHRPAPFSVAFRNGCEERTRRFPSGRFEWLPFGVDTDVF